MGYVSASSLEGPGSYLLQLLKEEGSVPYSRFYNHEDTMPQGLIDSVDAGTSHGDARERAHVDLEWAAYQLADAGIVEMQELPDRLPDDGNDYLIILTDQGREFVNSGESFQYRGMDL